MKRFAIAFSLVILLAACGGHSEKEVKVAEEDRDSKRLLQGIWLDDNTDMPLMRIKGDTIYYADPQNAPVAFKVLRDTIYVSGNEPVAYKIDLQTEYSFWFHSLADEVVKMHKSESAEDSLAFTNQPVEVIPSVTEVTRKDSVVMYKGTRYRGYVYINPSKMKVVKTAYLENGYSVDNIYYDNVIHICVYEGRNLLYGQDITRNMFADVLPADFLGQTILADMNFMGVDSGGYHYMATLRIPESSVYSQVRLDIGFDSEMIIRKAE